MNPPLWHRAGGVLGDGALLLLMVFSVPLAIIVLGAPIALMVRLIITLAR